VHRSPSSTASVTPLPWYERLIAPSGHLTDIADREQARLLAAFLLVLVALGWTVGIVQLVLVPGFLTRFAFGAGALTVLSASYGLIRSRHFRIGGVLACVAPPIACVAIGLTEPADQAWWAFAEIGVLLAVIILQVRTALIIGVAVAAGVAAVLVLRPGGPIDIASALAFHAVVTPLAILGAIHRNRIERQRQQALVDLEAASQMATVGHLARGIAHDFNNLLMVVQANVPVMPDGAADTNGARDVHEAVARARDLNRQLFAYAGRMTGTREVMDLRDAVRSMERLVRLAAGTRVVVVTHYDPDTVPVALGRSQFSQVIVNLAFNAREAMPTSGGTLRISVARDAAAMQGVVTVQDTGAGMPAHVLAHLFEPFFTTKGDRGTGLGLVTVRAIMREHGGDVAVESAEGLGTTFRLSLPLATA
jgi:signal transduction histidine kinase